MIRVIILIVSVMGSVPADAMPDCSGTEEFKSSVHGMLMSELLPVRVSFPEEDAKIRFKNGDYRLLGYGAYSGIKIPGSDLLENDQMCECGIKIFPGMTDSYESSKHRILAEELKEYIKEYNAYLLGELTN